MSKRPKGKWLGRRCLFVSLATAAVAGSLVGAEAPPATATTPPAHGDGGLDSFVCSLAQYVEPFDNLDVLGAVDKFLEEHEVDWFAFGAFALVTSIKQSMCPGTKAMTGLQHIRPLFPSLSDLTLQPGTPGYVVAPSTTLGSVSVEPSLGTVSADLKVSFLWVNGEALGEPLLLSAVDLRLDPFGGTPQHLKQGSDAGLYYVDETAHLTLGEWYQEALRADDVSGLSPWACSEPFRVYYDEMARSYYWEVGREDASALGRSCSASFVVSPSSWWYTLL
jgi:hypothetical protein